MATAAVHELDVDCLHAIGKFFTHFLAVFVSNGNEMAMLLQNAVNPSIHQGCPRLRNEQVVGSNPTSGSILLGVLSH